MKYCSIIGLHYSKIDDFGETAAGKRPPSRSDLVRKMVESVIANTDYPAEFVMMDNGGNPDDTDYFLEKVRAGQINTLVRYAQNHHFAYAWNQGAKLSQADYFCFICNDIEVKPGWLTACIKLLEAHPEDKLIATPFITYDKRRMTTILPDQSRLNPRSGSNCLVISRKNWEEMGEFRI